MAVSVRRAASGIIERRLPNPAAACLSVLRIRQIVEWRPAVQAKGFVRLCVRLYEKHLSVSALRSVILSPPNGSCTAR
eukprot:gene10650-biopygen2253